MIGSFGIGRRHVFRRRSWMNAVTLLISALAASGTALAQSAEEAFYKSNQVNVIVGMSTGNTYDIVGRAIARHIGKHIPGHPTVVAVNRPGAGSLIAANQVFNSLPKDGTIIGVFNRSVPTGPLLGTAPTAIFDATKFAWIGNVGDEVSVCVARLDAHAPTWKDFITKPMSVAATSMSADTGVFAAVVNNMFNAKLKIITGYPGGGEMTVALERGEVDGRCGWSLGGIKTSRPEWLNGKTISIPIQLGLRASPDLPGVPLIMDVAQDDKQRQILRMIFSRQEIAYPLAAPPGTPNARIEVLRTGFDNMVKDPAFLEEAKKMAIEVAPMTGADLERLIHEIYATSPELVAEAKRITSEK